MARIKIKQIDNSTAVIGDSIVYNGTKNVWANPINGLSINELSDIDLTGLGNGDILVYNSTSGNFEPGVDNDSQNLFETITADIGSVVANTSVDTFNILGGSNVSTEIVGDTVTINAAMNNIIEENSVLISNVVDAFNFKGNVNITDDGSGKVTINICANGSGALGHWSEVIEYGDDDDVKDKFLDNGGNDHKSNDSAPIMISSGEIVHISISTEKNNNDTTIIQVITNAIKGGGGVHSGGSQIGIDIETSNNQLDDYYTNLSGYNFNAGDRLAVYLKKGSGGSGKAEEPLVRVYVRYN